MRVLRAEVVDGTLEVTPIDGPLQSIPLVEAIAAPELLAACEACSDVFASWQVGQVPGRPADILALIVKVRAAVAKAREGK